MKKRAGKTRGKAKKGSPVRRTGRGGAPRAGWLNRSAIAARLGLDRRTVQKYLAMAGAPPVDGKQRHNFEAARAWIEKHAARISSNTEEMKRIKESMVRMEAEDMALDLAEKRGRLIDKKKIEPAFAAFLSQLTEDLRNKFEFELPPKYEGLDRAGRAKLNADGIDWVLTRLKSGAAPVTR